jgi:DNA polymerase V
MKPDGYSTRFVLVDCNNFYVSCERTVRPELNGRPTVVLSGPNGCVISRSNEAKAMGIPMGAPYFQCRAAFEAQGGVALPARFSLYDQISRKIMGLLKESAPQIEVYSIDEAFLRMERISFWDDFLTDLHQKVLHQTGIPVSLGVGPTKTLAKVAARMAKKQTARPYATLENENAVAQALRELAVEDLWGIGRRNAQKLAAAGVLTAWDLRCLPVRKVKKLLHLPGLRIQLELHGHPAIAFSPVHAPRKSVSCSRTLAKETGDVRLLRQTLAGFARICAEKLRADAVAAQSVGVYLRTNRFRTDKPRHVASDAMRLDGPTQANELIAEAVGRLFESLYRPGCEYKKLGVWLGDFVPAGQTQLSLFDDRAQLRRRLLHQTIDRLNAQMGKRVVRAAAEGPLSPIAFNPFRRNAP